MHSPFLKTADPVFTFIGSDAQLGATPAAVHANAQAGDLAILAEINVASNNAAFPNAPSGWTALQHNTGTYATSLSHKILTASDLSQSFIALGSGNFQAERILAVFRRQGVAPTHFDFSFNSTHGVPVAENVVGVGHSLQALKIGIAMARTNAGGGSLDTNFNNAPNFETTIQGPNTNPMITFAWSSLNNPPADINIKMDDAGFHSTLMAVTFD